MRTKALRGLDHSTHCTLASRAVLAAALALAGCGAAPTEEVASSTASAVVALSNEGRIHPFGGNSGDNLCIEVASRNGGTGVNVQECFSGPGDATQEWIVGASGHIELALDASIAGEGAPLYCLNVQNVSQGTIDVESCNASSKTQAWTFYDGRIMPAYYNGCLDVFSDNQAPGTWLDLAACNDTPAQVFLPEGMTVQLTTPASGTVYKMLDVKGGDSASTPGDTPFDLDQSNQSAAQYFYFAFGTGIDGYQAQIEDYASHQCLSWQLGASYNPAFLYPCPVNNDAYWYYSPQQQFVARGFNWCLDVNGDNPANGTPIDVAPCNGTPAQSWHITLPGLVSPACKKDGVNVSCSSL